MELFLRNTIGMENNTYTFSEALISKSVSQNQKTQHVNNVKTNPKFLCPSNYIANVQYYLQKNDIILSGDPFILLGAKNFETHKKA